ncbi:MlaD family protein [Flavobacterium sp.]|uniref:MlaD family protein n=1 Tax=Flavobacterium sp. TaxID=239 RepID=UPI003B9CE3A4
MKLSRELKTAILVVSSILLFIWGYNFLKGSDLFDSSKTVYVKYKNVEGLLPSAAVTINGLAVGKVQSITLDPKDASLLVELKITGDFPISKSSKANLYEPGLIGGKQVQIIPNLQDTNMIENGTYLQGEVISGITAQVTETLKPLQEKISTILSSVNVLLNGINNTLDTKTQNHLKNSIAELEKTMTEFKSLATNANDLIADNKGKLNSTIANFDKTSGNFAKISDSLAKVNIGQTVKKLESTLANMDKIIADLQSGKGTAGKILKDEAMYSNFNKTAKELELLLQDLRLNPTRYINVSLFGKKNKPYKAPETNAEPKP